MTDKEQREHDLAVDKAVKRLKRSNDRQVLNGNLRLGRKAVER